MIKKSNFLAAQRKEKLPQCDTIIVFTEEEIKKFKEEAFSKFLNGKRNTSNPRVYPYAEYRYMSRGKCLDCSTVTLTQKIELCT